MHEAQILNVVSTVEDGYAIFEDMKTFGNVILTKATFGRLTFAIDTDSMNRGDADCLIDDLNEIDDVIACTTCNGLVEFDYCLTATLLPAIRKIVERYCNAYHKGNLLYWIYDDIISAGSQNNGVGQ